jgi:integrase
VNPRLPIRPSGGSSHKHLDDLLRERLCVPSQSTRGPRRCRAETVLRVHLAKAFGDKRLDEISTEDVQRLKAHSPSAREDRERRAYGVECGAEDGSGVGCNRARAVLAQLLKAPKNQASFHDFDEFERLVEVARSEALAFLVVLLGGEAGLRCGEMMALEWTDIDFAKRQLTRGAFSVEGSGDDAERRAPAVRADGEAADRGAAGTFEAMPRSRDLPHFCAACLLDAGAFLRSRICRPGAGS